MFIVQLKIRFLNVNQVNLESLRMCCGLGG